MKSNAAIPLHLFVALLLVILSKCQAFNFFYFVQQWPGSSCDTKQGCCYPTSGKPAADFGIRGLWPNNNDRSSPSNCNPNSPFSPSQELRRELQAKWPILACPISNELNFWSYEWKKHRDLLRVCPQPTRKLPGCTQPEKNKQISPKYLKMLESSRSVDFTF